ncbi:MAG: AmmeMemoRadiSam system radical SAM enzyme [Candidatus Berkelbacteria bacterium]|nr:AmmeMemoRadiSam system radical SAM enzyme [Candidatus Berkelbacteria bacterium]
MIEAKLYNKLQGGKVKCGLCNHRCLISHNKTGICGVRLNKDGKLYSLVYGRPVSVHIDPIEKKPLYHFMPGTFTLSFGTFGCNLRCDWCQNWEISQINKRNLNIIEKLSTKVSPKQMVAEAKKQKCPSISYTYTEPTIFFEYALETMKLAHKSGLKNIWVSNGYFTKKAFRKFEPYLDAINIDLKGFSNSNYLKYCGARLKPVLKNLKRIKKARHIHLEITTLLIPGINNSEKELKQIAEFIASLDKNIPWHLSRFFPCYKMTNTPPTSISTLKKAQKIGLKVGLKYVYLGNV